MDATAFVGEAIGRYCAGLPKCLPASQDKSENPARR
jgi:hypothetical protein